MVGSWQLAVDGWRLAVGQLNKKIDHRNLCMLKNLNLKPLYRTKNHRMPENRPLPFRVEIPETSIFWGFLIRNSFFVLYIDLKLKIEPKT